MRTVQTGPVTALIAQVLLFAALAGTVGLSGAGLEPVGWVVGVTCGLITNAALARGLSRYRADRLSPADWVTLARATLAVGVAALVADSFNEPAPVAMLVSLSALALALDAVDGWVARRTRTARTLGAHFDAEVDAFLILVLSVYVARSAGAWVLAIGAARYVFLAAGWLLPWMREPLPPRYWRKVVAATQGIVLTVAAANVLPPALTSGALVVALVLLAESFGRDVWWLRSHRLATEPPVPMGAEHRPAAPAGPGHNRVRRVVAGALTVLAALALWVALVAPDQPKYLTPTGFMRVPLEGLVLVAVAVFLPKTPRRVLAVSVGSVLTLVVLLKVINYEVFTLYDRPYDPLGDTTQLGNGIETLRSLVGGTETKLIEVGAGVGTVVLAVLLTLAMLRLTRVAAENRRWALRAVAGLGAVGALCWAFGAQLISHTPIASTLSAGLVVDEVNAVRADIHDRSVFAAEIKHDPIASTPTNRLLTALRGKDVLLVFVEAYGQLAVQGASFSPEVDAALSSGRRAIAERRLLRSQRLPHLGDVRRHQLAGALEPAGGTLGQQPGPLQPADIGQTLHARRGVQAGRVADRRRRSIERPPVAAGEGVLPLRRDLQPLPGRLSRPHLHLRVDARPVHLLGAPAPRARQASQPAAVRRGRHGVEPHAVEPHPPPDRLEPGRQRLDLQPHPDGIQHRDFLGRPAARAGGVRPVDRVLPEHADLVRAALRQEESRDDRAR